MPRSPSELRVSGLRGPRSRAGGEVLVASFTVSLDNADGEGFVPDAAVFLAATAWGRVRRRRKRRGRVAWVRGSSGAACGEPRSPSFGSPGVLGAVLVVRFWWLAARFLCRQSRWRGVCAVPQSLCRMLPCFWLLPRRDVRGLSGSLGLRSIGWTAPYSTSARKKTFIYKYSRVSARKFLIYMFARQARRTYLNSTRALARGNFSIYMFARQRDETFEFICSRVSAKEFFISIRASARGIF